MQPSPLLPLSLPTPSHPPPTSSHPSHPLPYYGLWIMPYPSHTLHADHAGSVTAAGAGDHPLPSSLFSVDKLLQSVSLRSDAAQAPVPIAIRTQPKPFQLQV